MKAMKNLLEYSTILIVLTALLTVAGCQPKNAPAVAETVKVDSTAVKSLVMHLPFDGSISDSSMYRQIVSGHNIQFCTDRFGNANSAIDLNGKSSWLDIESDSRLDFHDKQSFSVTCWVKVDRFTIDWSILRKKGNPVQYFFGFEDDRVAFGLDSDESTTYSQTTLFPDTWYFVAGVYNAEDMQLSIYINSLLDSRIQVLSLFKSKPGDLETGRTSTRKHVYYLDGALDELRVYNRPLSDEELQELYHAKGWNL